MTGAELLRDAEPAIARNARWAVRAQLFPAADADDVAQELRLALLDVAAAYDPGVGEVGAFAHVVARRRCVDQARRNAALRRRGERRTRTCGCALYVPVSDPALDELEELDSFEDLIRTLPEEHREVFRCVFARDMTYEETSRATGYSKTRACQIVSRGLDLLFERFRPPEPPPCPNPECPSTASRTSPGSPATSTRS